MIPLLANKKNTDQQELCDKLKKELVNVYEGCSITDAQDKQYDKQIAAIVESEGLVENDPWAMVRLHMFVLDHPTSR
jgi:hypothetical protein